MEGIYIQTGGVGEIDVMDALRMYTEMKLNYTKALKTTEHLKHEVLTYKFHIKTLDAELMGVKKNKEALEIKLEKLQTKKNHEILFDINHINRHLNDPMDGNKLYGTALLDGARQGDPTLPTNAQKVEDKGTQCSETSSKSDDWMARRSVATQTRNLEEISSLVDRLNDMTIKYKTLCLEKAILERNLVHATNDRQMESAKLAREREIRQKCSSKMEKMREERDAAVTEYRLVMSERDAVHEEIDQLQDQLTEQTTLLRDAQKKIEMLERSERVQVDDRTEEEKVMREFDRAIDEERRDRSTPKLDSAHHPRDSFKGGTFDRKENLVAASVWMQNNFREDDSLKRQLQQTIAEFAKRDVITKERDSMRIMCDRLRLDRDAAVNELIRAKKESDELKKQRNQALGDLKVFRETCRCSSTDQNRRDPEDLISHSYSKDSAIDSDFQEWETELINLDIGIHEAEDLGFELAGGPSDRNSTHLVYIKDVLPHSPAFGVVRVNDQIMQVNSIDVAGADRSFVCQLIRQSPRPLHMLIKRKKSCPKLYPGVSQVLGTNCQQKSSRISLPRPVQGAVTDDRKIPEGTNPDHHTGNLKNHLTNYLRSAAEGSECDEVGDASAPGNVSRGDEDHDDSASTSNKRTKSGKNLLNKAFIALAKPFRIVPKDSRSKSFVGRTSDCSPSTQRGGKRPESALSRSSLHETWPKCRSHRLPSNVKKVRPKLDLDFISGCSAEPGGEGTRREGLQVGQRIGGDSTKDVKTSSIYHYVQVSDPVGCTEQKHFGDAPQCDATLSSSCTTPVKIDGGVTSSTRLPDAESRAVKSSASTADESALSVDVDDTNPSRVESTALSVATEWGVKDLENIAEVLATCDSFPALGAAKQESMSSHSNLSEEVARGLLAVHGFPLQPVDETSNVRRDRISNAKNEVNQCALHRCGTVGKTRSPNRDTLEAYRDVLERMANTRTLPRMHGSIHSMGQQEGTSLFSCSDQLQRNLLGCSAKTFHRCTLTGLSSCRQAPRLMRQSLFHTPSTAPIPLAHTSSPLIPFNSSLSVDPENSISHLYHKFLPSSKSDALLDVKQKFCRHLETDYSRVRHYHNHHNHHQHHHHHLNHRLQQQQMYGLYIPTNFVDAERGSCMNALGYEQTRSSMSADAPQRCVDKIGRACRVRPSVDDLDLHRSDEVYPVQPSSSGCLSHGSNSDSRAPASSLADFSSETNGLSLPTSRFPQTPRKLSIRLNSRGSATVQRNSEPVGFNVDAIDRGPQVSSVSEGGLTSSTAFQSSDPHLIRQAVGNLNPHRELAVDADDPRPASISEETEPLDSLHDLLINSNEEGHHHHLEERCFDSPLEVKPSGSPPIKASPVRTVMVERTRLDEQLGISIVGGNVVGIFISDVMEGSVAARSSLLRVGDRILEFNGVDLRQALMEEAVVELAKPCRTACCLVQSDMEAFKRIQNQPCDSLYVRSLFDRFPTGNGELSFSKGDVLFVDNTCFNNNFGLWWAYLIDRDGLKTKCGTIASRLNRSDGKTSWRNASSSVSSGGSVRRSFFKRQKNQTCKSRDEGRASLSDVYEADPPSGPPEDSIFGLYEKVEKLDPSLLRPVLIVGTFADGVIARLSKDFPHKFYKFVPEFGRRKSDDAAIVYGTESGGITSIPIDLLKSSMMMHHHSLLSFPVELVPKFLSHKICFVVILIKYKSYKQIKEARDWHSIPEKTSTKQALDMFEASVELEKKFGHLINEVVPGGSQWSVCSRIVEVVEREQSRPAWMPVVSA